MKKPQGNSYLKRLALRTSGSILGHTVGLMTNKSDCWSISGNSTSKV